MKYLLSLMVSWLIAAYCCINALNEIAKLGPNVYESVEYIIVVILLIPILMTMIYTDSLCTAISFGKRPTLTVIGTVLLFGMINWANYSAQNLPASPIEIELQLAPVGNVYRIITENALFGFCAIIFCNMWILLGDLNFKQYQPRFQ